LIEENLARTEHVFSASVDSSQIEVTREGLWAVETARSSPPFYQVGYVGLVVCDRWYELYVQKPSLRYGTVQGHTGACDPATAPTPDQARQIFLDHLSKHGYDVSAFPGSIPERHSQ
jgi:hypothetical protein